MKRYRNGKRTVAAFVAATFWLFSTLAAFGANDETSRSSTSPVEPFASTAKIDPQTTVFLYLADAADENLRRIYVECNKAIRAAVDEAAGGDAFKRFLKEEEERERAKLAEIKEAAALEHDAAFRKIETESKTPEEKAERVECFYEDLGVRRPGTTPQEWAAARERSIELESNRYLLQLWPLRPQERARLRVAQETWRLIESKIWPELSVDWENLNLDGARFDFRPEVLYDLDASGRGFEKFGGYRWGIPATLEQLSRSKSWRDKTLRGADFYRVFADASFAGWTLENCRFWADESGQGTAFDVASKAPGVGRETRRPGELWQGAATENASAENANGGDAVGYVGCDFAGATLKNVLFDRSATITFAQFAATRSFKEDEIDAEFRFPLDGWDFAGKNVDALRTVATIAAEVASGETASESAGEATDDAASFAAEKPTVDESERVVYLFLKDAQSESAQALRNAWAEKVRAAKAENGAKLDAFFFYEGERNADGAVDRTWTRVFNGTAETLKSAKIDVDWENLSLDGVHFSASSRRWNYISGCEEKTEPYGDVECPLFVDDLGTSEIEYALPTTLAKLRRTVNWREKRLSDASFSGVCLDESFAGWTLTKCAFGTPNEPEARKRWPDGCKRADFTDATLDRCWFDDGAVLTFKQFAATRSYREDKICVSFDFPLNGWDFAGKNIGDVNFGKYAPQFKDWARYAKCSDARFEPSSKNYPKGLPEKVWRNSRACKEKDLAGATFPATLGGGDFSGFDLTGATMFGVNVKLDGATIRGLRVVAGTNYGNSERERIEFRRQREYGKITKETICATKSWRDKDLRDVEFNWFYDLTGVDFSGCDLRGATFRFAKGYGNELEKAPFFEDVDFTDAKIDGCRFEVFAKEGERSWPTLEQIMSTETWKSGDLERLKTCVLPDEAQKIVDRRLFEASPEFAAKDFSGKEIKFRDMSDWDLSGLNLTGCEIRTRSLYRANFTDAILDGATLEQSDFDLGPITTERLLDLPFLSVKTFIETDNYRRKNFRGFRVSGDVLFWRDFSFAGLDLTNATFYSRLGGFDEKALAKFDFTDAEIEGFSLIPWLTKKQLLATKTFKEGRLDYEAVDRFRRNKKIADELRAEYERLQAEKAENAKTDDGGNVEKSEVKEKSAANAEATDSKADVDKKKSLAGETFSAELNGGDFSGYDLTGATMKGVEGKLDGATIRGLKVVSSGRGDDYTKFDPFEWRRENEYGKITKERLCATKSWQDKDLRDVEFNRFYDLTGVDFSGCDLRGATFLFPDELNVGETFFENVDFTDAKIDGCVFYVFTEEDERSWPTLEQLMSTETWKSGDLERLKTCVFPDEAQKIVDRRIFEASPEFAAKDFRGKKIEFRDMSGWDLSGLNLTGCVIETYSLWGANLTGAILDDATLRTASYPETFASTRAYHKRFLSFEQLLETDNYRRKSFRGLKLGSLEYGNFSFAGLDWTNANFYGLPNYVYREKKAARDFTDAEIEGGDLVATLTKEQLLSTKTFKEGRLDYDEVDKLREADDQIADELRAEYERLQAEKGEKVENSAQPETPTEARPSENVELAAEEKPEERVFYLFSPRLTSGFSSKLRIVEDRFADRMWANERKRYRDLPDDEQTAALREVAAIATRYLTPAFIPNWEELSLDGFWIDDWHVEFDPVDGYPYYGIPATLDQLRRTKTWREKKARDVIFDCSLEGESFAGWTFERCSFGPRYRTAKRDILKGCDFTDATLNGVYFGNDSAITFEQFAASRSFKEDEICAQFGFPLGPEWNFSGQNVERSSKEPPPIADSKAELTVVVSRDFDGAPLDWRRYDGCAWDDRRPNAERLRVSANKEPIRPLATAEE